MKYLLPALLLLILASCCKPPDEETPDITTGLTLNMSLDGTALDSVSQTTGTIHSATATENRNGEAGKAMMFIPADSAYIDMGDLAGASFADNIFTISCWVKVMDTTASIAALSKRNGFSAFEYSLDNHFYDSSFTLDNWVSNGGGTVYGTDPLSASVPIAPSQWMHIAYVADGDTLKVYENGMLKTAHDLHQDGKNMGDTDAHFVIGNGGPYGQNFYFNGAVDDVRFYNRALYEDAVRVLTEL